VGDASPDVDPRLLKAAFNATQQLLADGLLLSGHDISDGGIATTVRASGGGGGRRRSCSALLLKAGPRCSVHPSHLQPVAICAGSVPPHREQPLLACCPRARMMPCRTRAH
jgi:hypothetical protein